MRNFLLIFDLTSRLKVKDGIEFWFIRRAEGKKDCGFTSLTWLVLVVD